MFAINDSPEIPSKSINSPDLSSVLILQSPTAHSALLFTPVTTAISEGYESSSYDSGIRQNRAFSAPVNHSERNTVIGIRPKDSPLLRCPIPRANQAKVVDVQHGPNLRKEHDIYRFVKSKFISGKKRSTSDLMYHHSVNESEKPLKIAFCEVITDNRKHWQSPNHSN
ncbi:hypothetical protein PCE1_002365 [Barthelona sp. PCE]